MKHHVTNREYWRSLEELADGPEVRDQIEKEFPGYDPEALLNLSRRSFMRMMGASLAMAGVTLSGCRRWPEEKLAPFATSPKDRIPGIPEQYATVMELGGVALPLLVTSFDGRPIKIEGNPSHLFSQTVPGKLGSADAIAQASVLEMYDPDRSRTVVARRDRRGIASSWEAFRSAFDPEVVKLRSSGGAGLAVLSEATRSPTTLRLKAALLEAFPKAKWHEYEPLSGDNQLAGAKLAYGQPVQFYLHLDKAAVIVSFDADLLGTHPAHTRYAADWVVKRRSADDGEMNRLYLAESCFSITGGVADQRLPVKPSRMAALMVALAQKLGISGAGDPGNLCKAETLFVENAAADLLKNPGMGVVAAGPHLAAELHRLACQINDKVASDATLTLLKLEGDRPHHLESIASLAKDISSNSVSTLLILGGNPAFDAPSELGFARLMSAVPFSARLGLYEDETSLVSNWHLPRAHYLESWGDARAWDGTVSVQQPLIMPIYGGKSVNDLLALVVGENAGDGDGLVRKTFSTILKETEFEKAYRRVLHDGFLQNSGYQKLKLTAQGGPAVSVAGASNGFEVRYQQDLKVYDGRFANNGWLQEMPDPITKMTWDNPAHISVKDAADMGLSHGDMVTLTFGGASLDVPAYVLPGQPIGVIGLPLGYGRALSGNIGTGIGFNTYAARTSGAFFVSDDASLKKTGGTYKLSMTQNQYLIDKIGADERDERVGHRHESGELIHEATLSEIKSDPKLFSRNADGTVSLQQLFEPPRKFNDPHAWGMAVDINSCIGCNACVVACQAENNIPIVGKEQVANNRAMHWIRIDRWFKGDAADADIDVAYQPVMCQHCENAPCEQVCPVAATTHDTEGLNTMVYNRCIGTRYCSNNCPYKVRRFNYLDWHSKDPRGWAKPWLDIPDTQQREMVDKIKRMVFNPDVTVRMRGVMEKCTYCVQRIHGVQIDKGNRREPINDGDIVTACQQACPTEAIVFGDLNDPNSKVTRLHKNDRAYSILNELNTRPRTRYLAKVRNPAAETERSA